MYGKYNTELDLQASGAISGGTLQDSGTLTLTFSTTLDSIQFERKILAIDWNGNALTPSVSSSAAGGSWTNDNESVQAGYGSSHIDSVNMAAFRNAYASHGSNLGGLRIEVFISQSSGEYIGGDEYDYYFEKTASVGAPGTVSLAQFVSRDVAWLSWTAGSDGAGNTVTGYEIQRRESSDAVIWGAWTSVGTTTYTGADVSAPSTVGNYYQFRVRTLGSAGDAYHSEWTVGSDLLRRAFDNAVWTDPTLTARVSMIRAIHITELQKQVNVVRKWFGLSAFSFTPVTERVAKISKWASLIQEIRDAVDGITTDHEGWNTLEAGKPKIANITQLRRVIDNI